MTASSKGDELPSSKVASQDEIVAPGPLAHCATRPESIGKQTDPESSCIRSMSMTMDDPTLCRSVLLHKALRRLGLYFASNQGSDMEFGLSEQASEIDDFISHDWRTGRWSKVCSMLIVYNGRLAIFASHLVAILLCALQTDAVGLLPRDALRWKCQIDPNCLEHTIGMWSMAVSCPIFLLCLCFGHNLAVLFSMGAGHRRVFVDKLCICQTNEDLKTKGIRALAGILNHSRRLVILWSPRYLKRLWCVYELTSWMHYQTKHHPKPIRFVPVALGRILLGGWAVVYCGGLLFIIFLRVESGRLRWLLICVPIFLAMTGHYIRPEIEELLLIPDQLANFHVESSECFCCTVGHIHPETGVSIPCDRELIHETLIKWANSQGTPSRDSDGMSRAQCMHYFDSTVQFSLKSWAEKSIGVSAFSYDYAMLVSVPLFWLCADYMAGVLSKNLTAEIYVGYFIMISAYCFFCGPVSMKCMFLCGLILGRRCATRSHNWFINYLVTLAAVMACSIVCAGSVILFGFVTLQRKNVLCMLLWLAWGLATFALFNTDRLLRTAQRFISVACTHRCK